MSGAKKMNNPTPLIPLYYDQDVLIKSPTVLYRTQHNDKRYYYSIVNNLFKKYPSVTTVLDKVMPTSEYLIKWISQHGYEKAMEIANQKSEYGTLDHIVISQLLIDRRFDVDSLSAMISTYKYSNQLSFDTSGWHDEMLKDIYAFHVFAAKHEIEPIAVSIMLMSDKLKIAGELDMVVRMKIGTGVNGAILKNDIKVDKSGVLKEDKTRTITAIIDIKSGRHGFYPSNEAQLHLYKALWDESFPHIPIDALYNWAPKNWNSEPDYHLKEQSNSKELKKLQHYIDLFYIDEKSDPKAQSLPVISGTLELGKINGNLKIKSLDSVLEKGIELIEDVYNDFKNSDAANGQAFIPVPEELIIKPNEIMTDTFDNHVEPMALQKAEEVQSQLEKLFNS